MMIPFSVILFILIIHCFADFAIQTHDQAINKSSSNKWLTYHVASYSFIWFISSYVLFNNWTDALLFASITFVTHWPVDWCTSRIGKPFWKSQDLHNGFLVVGIDQVIHYIQLFQTYLFLSNI